jgi:PAS domain-containing protein
VDATGLITSWNLGAERLLNRSEADAVGRHFSSLLSPDDIRKGLHKELLDVALQQGRAEREGVCFWSGGERLMPM